MFMLTQLAFTGATHDDGCLASNFYASVFSKRTKILGFIMYRIVKYCESVLSFQDILLFVF